MLIFLSQNKSFLIFIWSPEIVQNSDVGEDIVDFIFIMREHASVFLSRIVPCSVEKRAIDIAASMFLSSILTHVLVEERKMDDSLIVNQYIEEIITVILKGIQNT